MPANSPLIDDDVALYVNRINSRRMTQAEKTVEEKTSQLPPDRKIKVLGIEQHAGAMGIPAAEANFLALLTRLLERAPHPMKALDIGTFTGRSALAMAQAMPHGGKVIACDIDPYYRAIAEECWAKAKADGMKADIHFMEFPENDPQGRKTGDAIATLHALSEEKDTFDIIFIDANKEDYRRYYEKALELLRPGGLVVLDNMLWSGRVAREKFCDAASPDYDTSAGILRKLNEDISMDPSVEATLLSFEDGVMVVQKRARDKAAMLSVQEHGEAQDRHRKMLEHLRETTKDIAR